jgi:hypothetical protein
MDYTNARRQSRWRQRRKVQREAVVEELAQARERIAELEKALKIAQAQAESPAIPPSVEITRLKKANKELRGKLAYLTRWYNEEMLRNGKMLPATFRAIAKCLHPDHTPSAAEREDACKLFNAWRLK